MFYYIPPYHATKRNLEHNAVVSPVNTAIHHGLMHLPAETPKIIKAVQTQNAKILVLIYKTK